MKPATIALALVVLFVFFIVLMGGRESMSGLGGGGASDINNRRRITLHYTNWCGACKAMKPTWEGVKINLAQSGINFNEVDEDVAKTPYITSFPTIIMLTEKGKRVRYNGMNDFNQLRNWCLSPMAFV